MQRIAILFMLLSILVGCDDATVEGPGITVKYTFSTKSEFNEYYLPLQNDHGGIKSWVPSEDMDCPGGKVFTLADGYKATFCPANGDESLFK
jgi:hypothetical protein